MIHLFLMIIKLIGLIPVEIAEKTKTKQTKQNKNKKQNQNSIFKCGRVRPRRQVLSFHNFGNLGPMETRYDDAFGEKRQK